MPDEKPNPEKTPPPPDNRIRVVLSKIGETFDELLGRQAKASSSLATSELITRTKKMLDMKVRDLGEKGKFAPHVIQLKVEWGKFSTDVPQALKDLENELLAAVIDHINDNRYLTFAPLKVSVQPDYYVKGVNIITGFGKFGTEEDELVLNVTVPELNISGMIPEAAETEGLEEKPKSDVVLAKFDLNDMPKEVTLRFASGQRLSVGRTKEHDLALDYPGVSKPHASLYINSTGELVVSDVGSTNGTFINKERLAYGKAFPVREGDMVEFGGVTVLFEHVVPEPPETVENEAAKDEVPEDEITETTEKEPEGVIRIELGAEKNLEEDL